MKRKILTLAFLALSVFGFSQEIKTVFKSDTNTYGGYGGPLIKMSHINNDWGLIIGGKGGVVINRKLAFGGIGEALITNNDFFGDNLNGDEHSPLNLTYAAGGVFLEYIFNLESPVHISIPINLMAGGIAITDNTCISDNKCDTEVESSGSFIIEPGVNLEFNLSKHFISAINISYRQVFGSSLVNLKNEDLSGVSMGIILKFGDF